MSLAILNVGEGDTKLSFDPAKPEERERAARIVTDMLKRGFAIMVLVEVRDGEPLYRRVKAFDPETCEYIIAGDPGADEVLAGAKPDDAPAPPENATTEAYQKRMPKRRGRPPKRIPAEKAKAVGVARSAGGCARDTRYVR